MFTKNVLFLNLKCNCLCVCVCFCPQVMVTNVTSLLKTVKAVEDEASRGTRALEATIECIKQELTVRPQTQKTWCTNYVPSFYFFSQAHNFFLTVKALIYSWQSSFSFFV